MLCIFLANDFALKFYCEGKQVCEWYRRNIMCTTVAGGTREESGIADFLARNLSSSERKKIPLLRKF